MISSRKFVPAFLKKLDNTLLLHNPSVWSTRVHLVLFFGLLFAAALALVSALIFNDAKVNSLVGIFTGFIVVISIIGFVFWMIFLLRFNVFKRFGKWQKRDGLRTFLLFFIGVLMFVIIPFIPYGVQSFIANKQYSDAALAADINEINTAVNLLENQKIPRVWRADTFNIFKRTYEVPNKGDTIWDTNLPASDVYHPNNFNVTDADIIDKLAKADSTQKINDSCYIIFAMPPLLFVTDYNLGQYGNVTLLTSIDLYKNVVTNYSKPNAVALNKRLVELRKKYQSYTDNFYTTTRDYPENSYDNNNVNNYKDFINDKYEIYKITNTISNITDKKFWWQSSKDFVIRFVYYGTLAISLLVFIFRHSTKKVFFLSILSAIILVIITSLILVSSIFDVKGFYCMMLIYFTAFAIIAFSIRRAKTRTIYQGIGLNFFLYCLPLLPVILVSLYFEMVYSNRYNSRFYEVKEQYLWYAEIVGFVLLLILVEPLFKQLYKKWYALAED